MKHVLWPVLVAGLCTLGCGGNHHTATEPAATLSITNLQPQPFIRYQDPYQGELPLKFDFIAPDGNLTQVLVMYGDVTEMTPAHGVAGLTSGTISYNQSVRLPDPNAKSLSFTVQVVDAVGNHSNLISGKVDLF
jgi:hypothetical protein